MFLLFLLYIGPNYIRSLPGVYYPGNVHPAYIQAARNYYNYYPGSTYRNYGVSPFGYSPFLYNNNFPFYNSFSPRYNGSFLLNPFGGTTTQNYGPGYYFSSSNTPFGNTFQSYRGRYGSSNYTNPYYGVNATQNFGPGYYFSNITSPFGNYFQSNRGNYGSVHQSGFPLGYNPYAYGYYNPYFLYNYMNTYRNLAAQHIANQIYNPYLAYGINPSSSLGSA